MAHTLKPTNGINGDLYHIDESALSITLHENPPAPLKVAQPFVLLFNIRVMLKIPVLAV